MTSDDVAKAVAKRLKFYLNTERREDAFDLSGPYHPERNQPALRPGSSLAYEGLHDRSLKHYYRQKKVKQQLQTMKTVDGQNGREKQVKKRIESTMQHYDSKLTPNKFSPYAQPLIHQKNATQPNEPYFKPRKTSRRKKHPHMLVGKAPKVGRRAPDEKVSPFEQQRLVNMATKLIVATETIALPQNRRSTKGNQTDSMERLPRVSDDMTGRRESSASDPGPRATPHPPEKKYHSQRNRSARPRRWNDSSSGEISLDSTMDSVRSQMQELKLSSSGSSFVVSHKDDESSTTSEANQGTSTQTQTQLRPKSTGDNSSPNHTDSDCDDFYDHASSQVSPLTSPRSAWNEKSPRQTVDSCTQTVENKGTQTAEELENKDEVIEAWLETKPPPSRGSSVDKSIDHSTTSAGTQVEEVAQTKRRDIEPKVLAYEVFVVTGDKLGSGTNSDVKINMFGEFGDSGDRPLIRSKSNKNPFERKNVDLFIIDSIFLGDLSSIRIGHNGTALGTGWFLDRVVIREGENSARSFEFKCGRWLSARDDDGQIVRDLLLSATLSGNDVPKTSDANRTYFKYRRESTGSSDSVKLQFRPLSAKRDSDLTAKVTQEPKSSTSSTTVTKKEAEKPKRQYFTRDAEKSSSDDESEKEDDKNEKEADNVESHVKENDSEAKEIDEIELARKTVAEVIKAAQETAAKESENQAKKEAAKEKAAKDLEGNESDTEDVQTKEAEIENAEHEATAAKPKRRTKKRAKKERKNSGSESKKQNEDRRNGQDHEKSVVAKSPTNLETDTNHDAPIDEDVSQSAEDNDKAPANDENLPDTSNEDQNASELVEEDEIQAAEEADIAEKAAVENASNHSSDSEDSSSDSDSELFSLSSDSSSSDESKDEAKKDGGSDDEEEVERVEKDTSKKEDSNNNERKESAQEEYMAGFLAGVRASKDNIRKESQEQTDSVLTIGASIHQACESGDFDRIKELVNEVPELKKKPDERGWTPLHIVSAFGHLDILKWLTVNGITLTEETPTGFSAIHLAAMNGHVNCIMVLAAMGCSLGCRTVDEGTPLHLAAMSGHVECVKWLLANRANHAVHDANGRTPLDLAKEYQHHDCAELLELMENEMKRRDSIITKLRQPQLKDLERGESSKGPDNGLGGVDSGEDAWISDAEEDVVGRGDRPASGKARSGSFRAVKERKKSKQEQRADDEKEEKRKVYEKQQEKMHEKRYSFLDSIRQEIDDGSDNNF